MDATGTTSKPSRPVPASGVPGIEADPAIDPEQVAQALGRKIGQLTVENEQLRAALSTLSDSWSRARGQAEQARAEADQLRSQLRSVTAEQSHTLAPDTPPAQAEGVEKPYHKNDDVG